ncbi:MAG: rRNA maturation RNase YbeY [Acholeplasmataceae bacterium]|nr:rRNA maturation RNase YbeY [Acholeplasmataceae bacterium]
MRVSLHNQTSEDIKELKAMLKGLFQPIKEKKNMQIIFVEPRKIHELNLTYRHIDKPTDVLSFINDDESDTSLGDVFISLEHAKKQATDYGHTFLREIGFLAVHGYLHLKGYDHHTDEGEKKMIEEQERLLKQVNLERNSYEKY